MKCTKCGAIMTAQGGNRFVCDYCGTVGDNEQIQNVNVEPAIKVIDNYPSHATETRNCPCCGEEILATAKKCRYCGEWLLQETANINYEGFKNACWLAIFFVIIGAFFLSVMNFTSISNSYSVIKWLMPLTILCSGVLDVYIFFGLRKSVISNYKLKGIPFIANIVLTILIYLPVLIYLFLALLGKMAPITLLLDNMANKLDDMTDKVMPIILIIMAILGILLFLAFLVLQFIIGVQLTKISTTSKIGITLLVREIELILFAILTVFIRPAIIASVAGWVIGSIALYYYLSVFFIDEYETPR